MGENDFSGDFMPGFDGLCSCDVRQVEKIDAPSVTEEGKRDFSPGRSGTIDILAYGVPVAGEKAN